jgi:transposase-like protein
VDKGGNTVDFRLSDQRNVAVAKAFFKKAIRHQSHAPHTITLDGYAASHRAVREIQNADMLPTSTRLRSSKYLNNLVEQDHRGIKPRTSWAVPVSKLAFGFSAGSRTMRRNVFLLEDVSRRGKSESNRLKSFMIHHFDSQIAQQGEALIQTD